MSVAAGLKMKAAKISGRGRPTVVKRPKCMKPAGYTTRARYRGARVSEGMAARALREIVVMLGRLNYHYQAARA